MTTPTVPTAPILGHVEGVDLVDVGTWSASTGAFNPTASDLLAAAAAVQCPAVHRPILKLGHTGNHGEGDAALGYVDNLRVEDNGQTLRSDWRGMPAWLTARDELGVSILAATYPERSVECTWNVVCALGHLHPIVVEAVSLLGVWHGAVSTLDAIADIYGIVAATAQREEPDMPKQVQAAATVTDVLRQFYATDYGKDWDIWVKEPFIDPAELIVIDDDSDGPTDTFRVTYSIASDGTVTFSDPQPVTTTYVDAARTVRVPALVFATREESKAAAAAPTLPSAPAAGPPATAGGTAPLEEPMTDTLSVGLRKRLGGSNLADDADEATLLAALDEALAERAEPPTAPTTAPVPVPAPATGTVLVDATQLQQLRVDAAAGAQARATQLVEQRTGLVDAAIGDGRVPPARRDAWIAQLSADPGAETVLASLAPIAVPLAAKGLDTDESGQVAATVTAIRETPAYKNWSAGR